MGLLLVLFGCVALVLFLVSNCLIPFSSHKSCGVFQVSVEGHWTYSRTYVLVLRVSLRLFNLDCRYPRDLLQPARKKRESESRISKLSYEKLAKVLGRYHRWPKAFSDSAFYVFRLGA